jgi:2-aminoadipate transaminase
MQPPPVRLSALADRTPEQPISHFMKLALETPGLISLAAGFVDEESLPAADVAAALSDVFARPEAARAALQYGTTPGHPPLRDKVLARLAAADGTTPADLSLTPDDVVITTGSQQLLYLMAEALLDPGDIVITEAPSYFVYHAELASRGTRVLAVPMDDEGLSTDALEELLERLDRDGDLPRLKMIYTVDYFQNPTGLTLSRRRREQLFELVRRFSRDHRIIILEDAAYRELWFAGEDLPSIKCLDTGNQFVAYTSTFSKPSAPGLKTGYGILPADLVGPVLRLKGSHDFGSANFTQHLIDHLLASGAYDRHVAELRQVYREKAAVTLAALAEEFREWPEVRWTHPAGGLYVWMKFPPTVHTGPDSPLMKAALREGVLYIPGEFCHVRPEDEPLPTCEARLCYGVVSPDEIREAIHRLGRAVKPILQSVAKSHRHTTLV